jgi:hypothetical protein
MKKDLLSKTLVIAIVALFIGIGVQSAFATDITQKEEIEPKDYLYETIIAIANHPDVQDLFENNKNNVNFEFNNQYFFRKLFFKNPELLCSMVLIKSETTTQYLEKSYDQGNELVDIFGEEKALEMIDSLQSSNPEISDGLNQIIMNDEELSSRISTLIEMNNETNPICKILFILEFRALIKWISLNLLELIFRNVPALEIFFMLRSWLVIPQVYIISDIMKILDCW